MVFIDVQREQGAGKAGTAHSEPALLPNGLGCCVYASATSAAACGDPFGRQPEKNLTDADGDIYIYI